MLINLKFVKINYCEGVKILSINNIEKVLWATHFH